MSCSDVTNLAQCIWNDLGQPSDVSVSYIQSKLISNAFLGKLNSLLYTCHSGVSGYIYPELNASEQGIYSTLYQRDFWNTKVNNLTRGNDLSWVTLQEGDSRISRVNAVELARLYRDMQEQSDKQLNKLVDSYNKSESNPNSVDFISFGPATEQNYNQPRN